MTTSTGVPTKLRLGYNYPGPSNKFGLWLGPQDRQDKWPSGYATTWRDLGWKTSIETNLRTLKQSGVEVVRWFLLGNGFNYGLPPSDEWIVRYVPPRPVRVWHFNPPNALDPLFTSHFQQLLEIHRNVGMKMIPSLVSFEFFATNLTKATASGGRGEVATDPTKRNKFLFTVLGEFLRASDAYRDWIEAWEVINEPAWDVRTITPTLTGVRPHDQYIDDASMHTFIQLALDWIHDKKFESTVGHRFFSDLSTMPTGTKPQFHYYAANYPLDVADPSKGLPKASDSGGAFIGEFGSLIGKGFETGETPRKAQYGDPWSKELPSGEDKDPANTVFERLKVIKKLGYELALVWPEYDDPTVDGTDGLKISPQKLASLKRFYLWQ